MKSRGWLIPVRAINNVIWISAGLFIAQQNYIGIGILVLIGGVFGAVYELVVERVYEANR